MTFYIKDISEKKHNGNKIYHLHRSISVTFHKRFPSWMYLQCNSLQKIFSQERNSKVAFHKWYLSILWRNSEVNLKINTLMNTLIGAKKKKGKNMKIFFLQIVHRNDLQLAEYLFWQIHGKVDVRISTWDLYPQFGEYYRIFAKVNETVTGKEANDTEDFHFESDPWQARFSPGILSTFKPGLTYTIIVSWI